MEGREGSYRVGMYVLYVGIRGVEGISIGRFKAFELWV